MTTMHPALSVLLCLLIFPRAVDPSDAQALADAHGGPQEESRTASKESPSQDQVRAQISVVFDLAYPEVGRDPERLLAAVADLQELARAMVDESGSVLASVEHAVATQLNDAGHRREAIELLVESLDWMTAESRGRDSDWYLFEFTAKRLELLSSIRCLVRDRAGCTRSLQRLEQLLEEARTGSHQVRSPDAQGRELALELRARMALQVRTDIELSFGLIDRASRSLAELEQLSLAGEGALGRDSNGLSEDERTARYFLRRMRLRTLLALDRPESVAPALSEWRDAGEVELFSPAERGSLALLESTALFELERTGRVPFSPVSPFGELLKPVNYQVLAPSDRLRVRLMSAARAVELREDEQLALRLAEFESEAEELQADYAETALLRLALELRQLHLQLDAGGEPDEQRIQLARGEFDRIVQTLGGEASAASGNTFLYFGTGSEILSELVELECAVAPGVLGARAALEHVLKLQDQGGLAARLQLSGSSSGRVDALESLLELNSDRALICVPGRNQSRAFLLGKGQLDSFPLARSGALEAARSMLEERLSAFVALASSDDGSDVYGAVARLQELLVPRELILALRDAGSLAIVGPGSLGYVPFELFTLDSGEPLGAELAVQYWPSSLIANYLNEREPDYFAERDLAVFCRTEMEGDERGFRLPATEVRRLHSPFEASLSSLTREADFVQASLTEADARAWLIVAHGERPGMGRESSGLHIPGPGSDSLLAAESEFWKNPGLRIPQLVWLGACSAWQGPFRRGDDGTTHLPSRFLEFGARSVVLPFFELRYGDLAKLSSASFEELLADPEVSTAEALRRARKSSIAQAEDALGRLAPLLIHELGGPSRPIGFLSELEPRSRSAKVLTWAGALSALAGLGWLISKRSRSSAQP